MHRIQRRDAGVVIKDNIPSLSKAQKITEGITTSADRVRSLVHAGPRHWRIVERCADREPDWDDQSRWERFLEVWGFK